MQKSNADKVPLTVRMDRHIHDGLRAWCDEEGRVVAAVVSKAVEAATPAQFRVPRPSAAAKKSARKAAKP